MPPYSVTTDKTWARILDDIEESMRKWSVPRGWRVETILAPRSSTKQNQTAQERTVTLHWRRREKDYTITMSNQSRAVDNLLVIWLILETLRLNDARGYAQQIADVYRQEFPALPAPGQSGQAAPTQASTSPYVVLFVREDAPLAVCDAAYRALMKAAHPDSGGDTTQAARLNAAITAIRKERNYES